MTSDLPTIRFGASWSTQFRFTQAIGRGLSELKPIKALVVVGERTGVAALRNGDLDLLFSKSIVNEHQHLGKGYYAGREPATWLRTIAWLPQEDRFLFAVAPWTGIQTFEDITTKSPTLKMVGQAPAPVLQVHGFTYDDIKEWGGSVGPMEHTARAAKERYDRGELDAFFGDGSAYDFSAWRWVADRGYRFLDIREERMQQLEREYNLRRNITPAGLLPGIGQTLLALDDSHIVLTCHERLDEEMAYLLAKAVDRNKHQIECESIQVAYGDSTSLPLIEPTYWSSLTGHIERQWDQGIVGAPLHAGAERYYREIGAL
jgi:TRAP-type uncharacterized transport system substrate-binding protein